MSLLNTTTNGIVHRRTASLSNFLGEFLERAERMWNDPRVGDRYYVLSAARSRTHQAYLYNGFRLKLPGFAPANPPGTSDHEYWEGRPARAFDVHPTPGKGGSYAELHRIAAEYGFDFPIKSELWHMRLNPNRSPLQPLKPTTTEEPPVDPYRKISCPTGGYWVLSTADGGVGNLNDDGVANGPGCAPFFGAIPPDRISSPAVDLAPFIRDGKVVGYWIVTRDGAVYSLPRGGSTPHRGNYRAEWGHRVVVGIEQVGADHYAILAREEGDPAFVLDRYVPK